MIKQNTFFNFLIFYYWNSFYFLNTDMTPSMQLYVYLMAPLLIFITVNLKNLLDVTKITFAEFNLIFFIFFVIAYQLVKHDSRSAISILLFILTILTIYKTKVFPSLKLLNYLFIASIIIAAIRYYLGYSVFGILPNQIVYQGMSAEISGRVSLFDNVVNSMYFSFFIFTMNLYYNKSKNRYFFLLFSLYFMIFGVSRTLFILLFITILLYYLILKYPFKNSLLYTYIFPTVILVLPIFVMVFASSFFNMLLNLNIPFINSAFFHGETDLNTLMESFERLKIWVNHINLFFTNPLLGYSLQELTDFHNLGSTQLRGIGTESFLTLFLVRFGIVSVFFYIFVITFFFRALRERNAYQYLNFYFFIYMSAFYGSFFVAYNMLFLILLSSFNLPSAQKERYSL